MFTGQHTDQVADVERDERRVEIAERESACFEQYIYMYGFVQ